MLLEGHRSVFLFGASQLVGDVRCMQINVISAGRVFHNLRGGLALLPTAEIWHKLWRRGLLNSHILKAHRIAFMWQASVEQYSGNEMLCKGKERESAKATRTG